MRYFLQLSYDGTDYRGWQRQDGVVSVQETLEAAMQKVLKVPINIIGCGRTDAGVHASNYGAHFEAEVDMTPRLLTHLNYALPESIAVHNYQVAEAQWHARFSATERKYIYQLHTSKNPFLDRFSTLFPCEPKDLDWESMEAALKVLLRYEEYRSLCKSPDRHKTTNCTIISVALVGAGRDQFSFHISANRFLRGMIRILVAQLLDVGLGKESAEGFEQRLAQNERPPYFRLAPPQGLSLVEVKYPFL
jgi:tRNA pseudouridine38-40 synthase